MQSRKLLKKVGEALLIYASFLVEMGNLDKAVEVLYLALKNQTNVLLILSYRYKSTSRSSYRRTASDLYSRLFAVFFNLGYIAQLRNQIYPSFLFLNQCREISQLKNKLLSKEQNPNVAEYFNNCNKFFIGYCEITKIVKAYFK